MIQIRDLGKSFGGVTVLEDVDLDVPEGEVTCIIGRSGSGKSVLMRHIVGLMEPDTGRVVVDGAPLDELTYAELRQVRRKFGVLFQGGALFDSMSARDNVEFPLRTFTELTKAEIRDRADECLALVELPDAGAKKPAELSGGQQKRVALARAIAIEPKYILYDEPTSGLDPETSNTIDELIHRLGTTMGTTSVVVTHDMHSVLSIADRIAFVHDRTVSWTGTIDDLHRSSHPALSAFVRANEYKIGVPSQTA